MVKAVDQKYVRTSARVGYAPPVWKRAQVVFAIDIVYPNKRIEETTTSKVTQFLKCIKKLGTCKLRNGKKRKETERKKTKRKQGEK